jgi:16S rRNA (cytosine1402-N4)-methyltransferase
MTLLEMTATRRGRSARRISGPPARRRDASGRAGEGSLRHVPALASELIELLDPQAGQCAIDCTFGDGGHARLVAERLGPSGTLVAIDRDPLAEERFELFEQEVDCSVRFIRAGYAEALEQLAEEGLRADLAYFDLGMSWMQVDARERGFSYAYDAPLDMRMDPGQSLSAREIIAEWDERRLAAAMRELGEERRAAAIARAIVRRRERTPITTTLQLVEAINAAIPAPARFGGGHPAKRAFQALRIAVNDELGQLEHALPRAWQLLRAQGRLAVISFHSLEDRRVKRFIAEHTRGCVCPPELPVCVCGREPQAHALSRGAVVPGEDELERNPRSASAKLRGAQKLTGEWGAER